jgi:hypothetical protein
MKPIFWLGFYRCTLHGTWNSAQLCQNFGISGGVLPPNSPALVHHCCVWIFAIIRVKKKQPTKSLEGNRGIALLILNLSARRWWVVSTTPLPLYRRENPGTHCTGGWVGPRAGLDVCEKSRPSTGIRSPERPARSQSLYWLLRWWMYSLIIEWTVHTNIKIAKHISYPKC